MINVRSSHPRAAFTLIEVLFAIAVFAIVLAAVNTVFFGALKLRNRVTEVYDVALPLQQALSVMKRDLSAIQFPGTTGTNFAGQLQTTPTTTTSTDAATSGQRVSPDFYTASAYVDETAAFGDIQKVAYFLAIPTNGGTGRDLIRSVNRNLLPTLTEQPDQQWMIGGVQDVAFQFFNGSDWQDTWDSTVTSNLPMAVKVQIEFVPVGNSTRRETPIELVVPVALSLGRTNQTTTAEGGQ